MTAVNRYIGSPVERVEDLRFLRGRGTYVGDLVRPGMLHGFLSSPMLLHGARRGTALCAAALREALVLRSQ